MFDPAYKKLLAKSPASFQERADLWLVMIEEAIREHNAAVSADLFRAAVLSHLAIEDSEKNPSIWSKDGLEFAKLTLHSSHQMLSKERQVAAFRAASTIYPLGG